MEVLQIDNSAVRLSQIARLKEVRANRNEDEVQAALSALTASAQSTESTGLGNNPQNLMHLAINAARVRCTLGKKGWLSLVGFELYSWIFVDLTALFDGTVDT